MFKRAEDIENLKRCIEDHTNALRQSIRSLMVSKMYLVCLDFTVTAVSQEFLDYFGYTEDQVIGRDIRWFLHHDDLHTFRVLTLDIDNKDRASRPISFKTGESEHELVRIHGIKNSIPGKTYFVVEPNCRVREAERSG